jgi:uncharacterized membrane protein
MTVRPASHSASADIAAQTSRECPASVDSVIAVVTRHWLVLVNSAWAVVFGLPWLAPLLMKMGATWAGRVIYIAYGVLCHQFADRSFFLFGPQSSYVASELLPLAPMGDPRLALRAFRGTPALGYKVAWSDRMVAIYGGILVGGLLYALGRRWMRSPKLSWPALLLVPMLIDGTTHVLSDFAGLTTGFRYTNAWLATLTDHRLSAAFYAGNALGSFNSWARLITGSLAGLAIAWALYPALETVFAGASAPRREELAAVDRDLEAAGPSASGRRGGEG